MSCDTASSSSRVLKPSPPLTPPCLITQPRRAAAPAVQPGAAIAAGRKPALPALLVPCGANPGPRRLRRSALIEHLLSVRLNAIRSATYRVLTGRLQSGAWFPADDCRGIHPPELCRHLRAAVRDGGLPVPAADARLLPPTGQQIFFIFLPFLFLFFLLSPFSFLSRGRRREERREKKTLHGLLHP